MTKIQSVKAAASSNGMRILQLGKYYAPIVGGIERHLQDLCEILVYKGIEVTCIVSAPSILSTFEELNGVPLARVGSLIKKMPINLSLPFHLKRAQADIVHLHIPNPSATMSCLLSRPKNLVITYHADIVDKFGGHIYLPFQRKVLRMAKRIIVSNERYIDASLVLQEFRKKCVVVPFGINIDRFKERNKERITKIRNKSPLPLFLYVGRLVLYKGLRYLIDAMCCVEGTLLLVGNGPLLTKLRSQVEKLGLTDRVYFFTDVSHDELASYYHAADVVVLPSVTRAEAYGYVQLEAMACGKPVISTKLGTGIEYINKDMKTGLLVPPANAEDLSSAMNMLALDRNLRARLGKNGQQRVYSEFTAQLMVDRIISVYKDILER